MKISYWRLYGLALTLCVVGCTSQLPIEKESKETFDVRGQQQRALCTVSLTQSESPLLPKRVGRVAHYVLASDSFRLEVLPANCNPSVGVFVSASDFGYVIDSPVVVTPMGFSIAGDFSVKDVLFLRSGNPRLVDGFEGAFDNVQKEYDQLCSELGKCPQKIRAFRSYWNFTNNSGKDAASYAEFKRVTSSQGLKGFKGRLNVVVYTSIKDIAGGYLSVLQTHPMVLQFN
jgi:hypothetical protein